MSVAGAGGLVSIGAGGVVSTGAVSAAGAGGVVSIGALLATGTGVSSIGAEAISVKGSDSGSLNESSNEPMSPSSSN